MAEDQTCLPGSLFPLLNILHHGGVKCLGYCLFPKLLQILFNCVISDMRT